MADTTDVAQPTDDAGTAHTASPSRLIQALAWVGIVAGGLFVVAAVFLSGYFLDWSEHAHMQMGHSTMAKESKDCCADMKPGEPMKHSEMMPGGMMSPQPTTSAPPNTPRP
ncbi:hypothetical protein [Mycobacterium sp.]|uniref:hypothetical protein n=1 Tax=Mycobacterium sp. TaxID=1785 RepID=UPI003BB01BC8